MIPGLNQKQIVGSIMSRRGKRDVETSNEIESGEGMDPGLKEAAADIMGALQSKSVIDLAKALKAAFQVCEAMPHDENEGEE